ncbi:hypothetical protein ACFX14_019374 [Malus domestica]
MEDVQIEAETEDVEIAKQSEAITGKDQVQVPIDVQMDSQYVEADVQIEAETEDVEIAKQPEVITGKDQVQFPINVQMDS